MRLRSRLARWFRRFGPLFPHNVSNVAFDRSIIPGTLGTGLVWRCLLARSADRNLPRPGWRQWVGHAAVGHTGAGARYSNSVTAGHRHPHCPHGSRRTQDNSGNRLPLAKADGSPQSNG